MGKEFVKYRTFNDKALASELCRQLSENNIPFEWESTEGFFDVSFANNDILNLYYVKLKQEDFEKANALLADSVSKEAGEPVADYYLFSFSTEELLQVLKNQDEWNAFDQYWARKILAKRNVAIREEELATAKTERLEQLKSPWIADKLWLFLVFTLWILALWFAHYLLAIGVVLIGLYISYSKKTMPDGQRVYAFSPTDRKLGKITWLAGAALTIFIFMYYYGYVEFVRPL